jgi:xanthine dehydrogenase accessory factor
MDAALLERLNKERAARRPVASVTNLQTGAIRLVDEGGELEGIPAEFLREAFRSGKARAVEAEDGAWFLNPYLPAPRVVMIGAVHISQVLAPMAQMAGLAVEIIDPRTAFATPERFVDQTLHADWPEAVLLENPLDRFSALVALTHDPKIDDMPIQAALEAGCFYVGALGSRRTHAQRMERLKARGVPELQRIHAPIGLNIGAASPAEIAVAILAEVIADLRKAPAA